MWIYLNLLWYRFFNDQIAPLWDIGPGLSRIYEKAVYKCACNNNTPTLLMENDWNWFYLDRKHHCRLNWTWLLCSTLDTMPTVSSANRLVFMQSVSKFLCILLSMLRNAFIMVELWFVILWNVFMDEYKLGIKRNS